MDYNEILDEVISGLHPEDLPPEYIIMAKIIDVRGFEKVLRGIDLEIFLNNPNRGNGIVEARVIIDVRKIRAKVISILTDFFDRLRVHVEQAPPSVDAIE